MSKREILGVSIASVIALSAWVVAPQATAQMGMMAPGYGHGMMYGPQRTTPGYGPGMMGGCPMMGITTDGQALTFAEGRIAFLKTELGITEAQKTAWDAYADATKRNLHNMQSMWQSMTAAFEAKTPVERLDAHMAAMDGRLAALKEVKPALANLYATLSDNQKKKADEILTGIGCMM
jgi:hypothetical protein